MGVWIETDVTSRGTVQLKSHPAWVCGLKLWKVLEIMLNELSHPAWVCGLKRLTLHLPKLIGVTPCVGVWIETELG